MQVFLIMQRGPEIGRCYELTGAEYTIGRGPDNHLVLDDELVARYHAVIRQGSQRVVIVDLGGAHPVTVNDATQEPGTPTPLASRDRPWGCAAWLRPRRHCPAAAA